MRFLPILSVALRKESVDRNINHSLNLPSKPVALRKESVDRNFDYIIRLYRRIVALRKESVDRNGLGICHYRDDVPSLSARRAWIEMDWAAVITAMTSRRSPQGERG